MGNKHKLDLSKLGEDIAVSLVFLTPGIIYSVIAYMNSWFATCVKTKTRWPDGGRGFPVEECVQQGYTAHGVFGIVVTAAIVTFIVWMIIAVLLIVGEWCFDRYVDCIPQEQESEETESESSTKSDEGDTE